ncbi:MAG: HD domain-containing protein [Bacilli bacterium]|nr:HD domain-containing protein [Bacilli bacterium]
MKKLKEEHFYKNEEFYSIIEDILNNDKFNELKLVRHHGITRFNHSLRVSYYTYLTTKKLNLNYVEATRAALLHDFFTDELKGEKMKVALRRHPFIALENSKKYFEISDLQADIIVKHMFPVTKELPKYKESFIVDIIDDISSVYERTYSINTEFQAALNFILIAILLRIR